MGAAWEATVPSEDTLAVATSPHTHTSMGGGGVYSPHWKISPLSFSSIWRWGWGCCSGQQAPCSIGKWQHFFHWSHEWGDAVGMFSHNYACSITKCFPPLLKWQHKTGSSLGRDGTALSRSMCLFAADLDGSLTCFLFFLKIISLYYFSQNFTIL